MEEEKKEKPKEQKTKSKRDKLEKLQRLIDDLQKEKDELFSKLQRVSADYANYQKRAPKQIADTICYEKEKIIKTLLPILDNFEHTLANADSAEDADVLVTGIQIIYDQMLETLKSQGVEQIKAHGEKFDPSLHQAMMPRYEADKEDGIVLEEFQKGYKLNGRVIRPSKVIVNKPPSEQAPIEEKPEEEKDNLQQQATKEDETPDME